MRLRSSFLLPTALLVLGACGGGGGDTTNTGNNPTSPTNPTNPVTPTAPVETNAVSVDNDVFTPSSIKVATGTQVTWTWSQNAATHNVTLADGTGSGDKNAGDSFIKAFATAGTFSYRCTIHPSMTGSVQVQ